jgi:hypothetical protein
MHDAFAENASGSHSSEAAPAPVVPADDAPTWQEQAMRRLAWEQGANAMLDRIVALIEARYESGYSCEPWLLVKEIRKLPVLAAPSADRAAAPAPVATLTDEELADCGLLSELDDGEAVEVRKENGA